MARKAQKIQDASSDDDAPEVVSRLTSKANAKQSQKALHDFEAAEKVRRKARNREKDQKLKERARLTKGGKMGEKLAEVQFMDQELEGEDEEGGSDAEVDGVYDDDDAEARMLRAMRDARDEMESGEGEGGGGADSEDEEFRGFGQGVESDDDMTSGSDPSFAPDESDDAEMSLGRNGSMDPEALTDDEDTNEDEDTTPLRANIQKPSRKADYLADDLFAAAFAAQSSKPALRKDTNSIQQQTVKKRRRTSARSKDLVIGGRAIRTLPKPLDARLQASARSVPSARAHRFVDQSLAMRGKRAILKAKKKGWERRPVNVGVMKFQGAPHGFTRSTR